MSKKNIMKAELIYRKIFNKNFQGQSLTFEPIDIERIKVIDNLTNESVILFYYEATIQDEEGNYLFDAFELNKFESFKDMNVCQNCYGYGFVDVGQGDEFKAVECECEIPFEL